MTKKQYSQTDLNELLPTVLPANWRYSAEDTVHIRKIMVAHMGRELPVKVFVRASLIQGQDLKVITSIDEVSKGEFWLHISFSKRNELPSWYDLKEVKNLFIGKDKLAVQVLPREEDYVNVHENTLHLYRRLTGDTLPTLAPNDKTLT